MAVDAKSATVALLAKAIRRCPSRSEARSPFETAGIWRMGGWGKVVRHCVTLATALVLSAAGSAPAGAETINIVALGDSGVFGSGQGKTPGGVPVAEAYPAKLEHALRARGWDVAVSNQGVRGGTARAAGSDPQANMLLTQTKSARRMRKAGWQLN
jgi:hypothetical protein